MKIRIAETNLFYVYRKNLNNTEEQKVCSQTLFYSEYKKAFDVSIKGGLYKGPIYRALIYE